MTADGLTAWLVANTPRDAAPLLQWASANLGDDGPSVHDCYVHRA